ncbi:hypothetical protein ABZ744_20715 [Micromonospora chersina]|uniref:hypothetical protein n=1 Tax=Micromonospora chersina TaxID=47854 RepID=UPI003402B6D1
MTPEPSRQEAAQRPTVLTLDADTVGRPSTKLRGTRAVAAAAALLRWSAAALASLLIVAFGASPAFAENTPAARLGAPFGGTWDRFGIANPRNHAPVFGGDLAFDYYGSEGQAVRAYIGTTPPFAGLIAKVGAVQPTCRSGVIADGGYAVRVDVTNTLGQNVGKVWYGHLLNVPPAGTGVGWGTVLGTLHQFPYNSCYQVNTASGIHTHMETYSSSGWACWVDRPANTSLGDNAALSFFGFTSWRSTLPCPRIYY